MSVWNYEPCEHHDSPKPDCEYRACGGEPFRHQKATAVYSLIARKGLVANSTGTGKTGSSLMTLALEKDRGKKIKCVAVVPTTSVGQWEREVRRWTPGFTVASIPSKTPKKERLATYAGDWNILIIGFHVFRRDYKHIQEVHPPQIIFDDVDPILRTDNETHRAAQPLAAEAEIVIECNATSIQVSPMQLHAAASLIGGDEVFNSKTWFANTFLDRRLVTIKTRTRTKDGKKLGGGTRRVYQTKGIKNGRLLKKLFGPMHIRYTYEDVSDDVTIPDLTNEYVYFEMSAKQKKRYEELQAGVRTILDSDNMPAQTKSANALAMFQIGSQICSGTQALKTSDGGYEKDSPDASPKLNWIMDKLHGDWANEKVVLYSKFVGTINALHDRLTDSGIGYATIWGSETDPEARQQEMDRFWNDPTCKVMIISVSGERSLNLQVSSVVCIIDLQLNPARMSQIVGRVKRAGSKHKKVYVFQLLMENTQEERYLAALSSRQAIFDFLHDVEGSDDDDSQIIARLDSDQLLRLIKP